MRQIRPVYQPTFVSPVYIRAHEDHFFRLRMAGDKVMFFYLGAVSVILVFNALRWSFSPSWIDGLFTVLVFISFAQSILFSLPEGTITLSKAGYLASHSLYRGLMKLIFLELIYLLFLRVDRHPNPKKWWRWGQIGLASCLLLELALLLLTDPNWYRSTTGHVVSALYWCLLMGLSLVGVRLAAQRPSALGKTFILGSLFMLLNELYVLIYALVHTFPFPDHLVSIDLQRQVLWGLRVFELLWFSIGLLVYQRHLAVAKAVEKTQLSEQLKQERLEAELAMRRVEQEKTDVQLRALQAQVNPHFLFNSLNSLSALIELDPERASAFVDQLSRVYRYLLKTTDQALTTLASELTFIDSYYQLLKTRHGSGLTLTVQVGSQYEPMLLPPLTLQLLVENAVKHNIILGHKPLQIDIITNEAGYLLVSNTLQRKRTPVLSNGVGLSVILTQYAKLDQPAPNIVEDQEKFTVYLPLIKPLTASTEL